MLRGATGNARLPPRVLTAPQQIAAAIRTEILHGYLKPGDQLPPEHELAELFSVSRPTLRAALHELCAAQLLLVHRGRNGGYSVADLALPQLEANVAEFINMSIVADTLKPEQFLQVRYAHELLSAETAARNRSTDSLGRLEQIAETVEASRDDSRRAFETDLAFHRALADATRNPLIVSIEGAMLAVLRRLIGDAAKTTPNDTLGDVIEIIDAVRSADGAAAHAAMRRHLARSAAHFRAHSSLYRAHDRAPTRR